MAVEVDLGQKSLRPVTLITRFFRRDCDLDHGFMCGAALWRRASKPTIAPCQ